MDEVTQDQQGQQDQATSTAQDAAAVSDQGSSQALSGAEQAAASTDAAQTQQESASGDAVAASGAHPGLGLMSRLREKIKEWDEDLHAELDEELAEVESLFQK